MTGLFLRSFLRHTGRVALAVALALPLLACPGEKPAAAPPGYEVVRAVGSGRALSTRKADAKSVVTALQATLADLERFFGHKPQVRGAYEDSRDRRSGGAGFKVDSRGSPVRGFISCRIGPAGAFVAVIYARADASQSEWSRLVGQEPGSAERPEASSQEPERSPGAGVALKPYAFPDGTGVIGIAEGWRTDAQSCAGPVLLRGPADQAVGLGQSYSINTPDSLAVQNYRQMMATARQLGSPPPKLDLLVAPYTGPLDAIRNLAPQLSQLASRRGVPPFQVDNLSQLEELPPNLRGGKAARLSYGLSEKGQDGRVRHYRAEAYVETDPVGQGSWMLLSVVMRAPDASFDRDLPVMRAMVFSLKENAQAIQQKTQQALNAQNQWFQAQQRAHRQQVEGFERQQKAHRELTDAYDRQHRDWEKNQNSLARGHDDYDEVLRGYRAVEDTRTGVKTSVDLGNVDNIVDKLNEADPGRYRQIPLRDEMDPLPTR